MITLSKIISNFVGLPWFFQFFDNFSLDFFNIQHSQSNPCEKWWHLTCNTWGYTLKLHEWECFKLTLNSFQMLFLHEGYVGDYDLSQKHNTKSTWNPSLGNILMILLDSLLDLSCNLQNSVTFLENFFFVYYPTFAWPQIASSYQTNLNESLQKPHFKLYVHKCGAKWSNHS